MISIIVGTNREKSNSMVIAQIYKSSISSRGVDCQILNLRDLPSDFAWTECYGNRSEGYDQILNQYLIGADKFVFVLPEYHGGFPGVIKSFLDSFSAELIAGKLAALVGISSGRAGNLRGVDAFANILAYLKVEVLADRPKISEIENVLQDGIFSSEEGMDRIEGQIDLLLKA